MTETPDPLPPFSGDNPTCPKCGHKGAVTRHRKAGEPRTGEVVLIARAARYPERLERNCWRCDFTWDEALVEADAPATEHCIHDAGIHHRHHHTPVDGCPFPECSEPTGQPDTVQTGGLT